MAIYVEFTPEMAENGKWYGDIPPTRNAPKNYGNGKARDLDSL